MFVPRKPTPLGFMLHTAVDTGSGVLLSAEICEGAEVDGAKEYTDKYKKSTATTLRVTKRWHGSGRIIIADSWFSSYATAVAMMKHGLFYVSNVKTGHSGFPKQFLKSKMQRRGDRAHMEV